MSALMPYNYGGFSSQIQFGSYQRKKNHYYGQKFIGRQPFVPRLYPTQPNYLASFYSTRGYPATGYNQFGRSTMIKDLISLNQSYEQYRYGQYIRHMNEMQNRYWKQQDNNIPLSMTTEPLTSYYPTGTEYYYEKETRLVPFPVFLGQGIPGRGTSGNLGYGYLPNLGYSAGLNTTLANISGSMNLPPKIRVIFIPAGFPSSQQPWAGALAIPPFTFNRMSQPLCSLPLPPPLPQIGSLPLTPIVQQMVMQQYASPVTVFPFTPNWQISQPMISSNPQVLQEQQQLIMPAFALPPPQSIPQSDIPSTLMSNSIPVLPSNASPFLLPSNPIPSAAQYSNSDYPSTCRACIPAPPPLNISVTGHCWIQHCCACHHVPADAASPNIRPTNGRATPLLRHPTVPQYAYNPPIQQQQYPHINTSVTTRPWFHEMPPLPPGAVIISDQYIPTQNFAKPYHFSQKYAIQHPSVSNSSSRSISTNNTNKNKRNKTRSGTKIHKKYKADKSQSKSKSNSITLLPYSGASNTHHSSTSSSSCSLCNALDANEYQKSNSNPHNNQQNFVRKQVSAEARNINLCYNYQTPDLAAVYQNNLYLKSSDSDSTSLSNSTPLLNSSITKESNDGRSPTSICLTSIKEEEEEEGKKSIQTLSSTSFQSQKPVREVIIIRKFTTSSPSTISSFSSNLSLNIIDKDFDSIPMTSIIKTDQTDENAVTISETF